MRWWSYESSFYTRTRRGETRGTDHYKFQTIIAIDRSDDRATLRFNPERERIGTIHVPYFSDAGQIGYASELISTNHRHASHRCDSSAKSVRRMVDTYDTHAVHDEPELKLRRRNRRITRPCSVKCVKHSIIGHGRMRIWWIR